MYKILLFVLLVCLTNAFTCVDEEDCSLAGECYKGECKCLPMFKGENCGLFNLKDIDANHFAAMRAPDNSSWGAGAMRDENGIYHMFVSVMEKHYDLDMWQNHSTVVHAIATDPRGPYEYHDLLIDIEGHNPSIYRAPDGMYILLYIKWKQPLIRREISIGMSKSLWGPWKLIEPWITEEDMAAFDPEWEPVGNPTCVFYPNNSMLIYFTNCNRIKQKPCGIRATGVAYAPKYGEKITYLHNKTTIYDPLAPGYVINEDPHAFRYGYGYHLITHSEDGDWTGGHFYSKDGINNWKYTRGYKRVMHFTNGSDIKFNNRERPTLMYDEKGDPIYLFNGVKPPAGRVFTMVTEINH